MLIASYELPSLAPAEILWKLKVGSSSSYPGHCPRHAQLVAHDHESDSATESDFLPVNAHIMAAHRDSGAYMLIKPMTHTCPAAAGLVCGAMTDSVKSVLRATHPFAAELESSAVSHQAGPGFQVSISSLPSCQCYPNFDQWSIMILSKFWYLIYYYFGTVIR